MRRLRLRTTLLTVVSAAVAATAPAVSTSAAIGPAEACTVAGDAALRAASTPTPDGWYAHESWLADANGQAAASAVDAALMAAFGTTSKADPNATVARGLIGVTADHAARSIVVVVDAAVVDGAALGATLHDAVRAAGSSATVRVVDGCHSAADLTDALRLLASRSWAPGAEVAAFGFAVDPRDSTVHVQFDPASTVAATALAQRLGDVVTVSLGSTRRLDRYNDGNPHYGGAAIGYYNNRFCTSGFTVVLSGGGRGGTTAGHCFSNGQNVYSGTHFWGVSGGKSGYPTYDMMRVSASSQSYDNKIHVDPCCPSVRTVTGKGNPAINEYVCVSGKTTLSKCGLRVTSTSAQVCDADGCTPDLIRAEKPGEAISATGDSGGPMYTRPTTSTASIKGMIVAHTASDNVFCEKVSTVQSHLGVTVATS